MVKISSIQKAAAALASCVAAATGAYAETGSYGYFSISDAEEGIAFDTSFLQEDNASNRDPGPLFTLDYQKNVALFRELSKPDNVRVRDELKQALGDALNPLTSPDGKDIALDEANGPDGSVIDFAGAKSAMIEEFGNRMPGSRSGLTDFIAGVFDANSQLRRGLKTEPDLYGVYLGSLSITNAVGADGGALFPGYSKTLSMNVSRVHGGFRFSLSLAADSDDDVDLYLPDLQINLWDGQVMLMEDHFAQWYLAGVYADKSHSASQAKQVPKGVGTNIVLLGLFLMDSVAPFLDASVTDEAKVHVGDPSKAASGKPTEMTIAPEQADCERVVNEAVLDYLGQGREISLAALRFIMGDVPFYAGFGFITEKVDVSVAYARLAKKCRHDTGALDAMRQVEKCSADHAQNARKAALAALPNLNMGKDCDALKAHLLSDEGLKTSHDNLQKALQQFDEAESKATELLASVPRLARDAIHGARKPLEWDHTQFRAPSILAAADRRRDAASVMSPWVKAEYTEARRANGDGEAAGRARSDGVFLAPNSKACASAPAWLHTAKKALTAVMMNSKFSIAAGI